MEKPYEIVFFRGCVNGVVCCDLSTTMSWADLAKKLQLSGFWWSGPVAVIWFQRPGGALLLGDVGAEKPWDLFVGLSRMMAPTFESDILGGDPKLKMLESGIPSLELTYPFPTHFWRCWFSFSPLGGMDTFPGGYLAYHWSILDHLGWWILAQCFSSKLHPPWLWLLYNVPLPGRCLNEESVPLKHTAVCVFVPIYTQKSDLCSIEGAKFVIWCQNVVRWFVIGKLIFTRIDWHAVFQLMI